MAVDVGGTHLRFCIADSRSVIVSERKIRLPTLGNWCAEIGIITRQINALLKHNGLKENRVARVGISIGAIIDQESGVVREWPNRPYWRGVDIIKSFGKFSQATVLYEDDANAAALGEFVYGRAVGRRDFALVTVGTGIGCGLVLGGQLHRGRHGWAGEIGHTTVVPDGILCVCGKNGCLQALASGRAIERKWMRQDLTRQEKHTISEAESSLARAATVGNREAVRILQDAANLTGVAVANLINMLDLEMVLLSGGVTTVGEVFLAPLRDRVRRELANIKSRNIEVATASLGDRGGMLGVLAIALRDLGVKE